jgi:hypothetical protein
MTTRKNLTGQSGLVGMFVHTFKPWSTGELRIDHQGQIIGIDGDMVLVQLFSWFDGGETNVEAIPRSVLYSDCKLYATSDQMKAAWTKEDDEYDREDRIRTRALGWEENPESRQ